MTEDELKENLVKWAMSRGYSTGHADTVDDLIGELHDQIKVKCKKCNDTGFLFGAQNHSERYIKKHGNPYYTANCDCEGAPNKRNQYRQR